MTAALSLPATLQLWYVPAYAHDRRAHRHRCWACNRVLQAGNPAWMGRIGFRTTKAIHGGCADLKHGGPEASYSSLEALGMWVVWAFEPKATEAQALHVAKAAITKAKERAR